MSRPPRHFSGGELRFLCRRRHWQVSRSGTEGEPKGCFRPRAPSGVGGAAPVSGTSRGMRTVAGGVAGEHPRRGGSGKRRRRLQRGGDPPFTFHEKGFAARLQTASYTAAIALLSFSIRFINRVLPSRGMGLAGQTQQKRRRARSPGHLIPISSSRDLSSSSDHRYLLFFSELFSKN